jgi:D-sedoheptulose 7-phosphate isomerase
MLVHRYFEHLKDTANRLPWDSIVKCVKLLETVRNNNGCVFVFGNGGSAATASHFACDLGKGTIKEGRPRFKVLTLHDVATFSAYANDCGYETVFAEQLKNLAKSGDIAIGISVSGNSPNVLHAVEVARTMGLYTIGLTGQPGGRLKELVDLCIVVPSNDMQVVEDLHLAILHAVFRALITEK